MPFILIFNLGVFPLKHMTNIKYHLLDLVKSLLGLDHLVQDDIVGELGLLEYYSV